ncbi:NitT/TauT family transport system substrate-binding protein [Nonomuraea thailandensis]|uniref:NitT/TauT family transport system substrate-binding protein n=1 Tax=Nonomuraea thailandensis TaxID=1188745 RepID=A0A9X2GL66_9ACTN|nr:ABC transporter substrate-binding protein [Nonomuraea thailandensis]MCP2361214.1 NitT/TauT family transport system substrate-binding protein [Nonomuraea thailandensis]
MAVALALSACGGGGGEGQTGTTGAASSGGLEKTQLLVGVVPVPSSASLFIAEKRGFFKEEGLTVKTEIIQAPTAVMPKIVNGSMDAFMTSYVVLMTINDSGAAKLKLFQHTMGGAPNVSGVVVAKGSPIKAVADLKGKTVGVNVLKALGQTVTNAHLQEGGVRPEDVKFVPVPFADQLGALSTGKVDAAWLVEPFLSAAKKGGATQIIDTTSGVTEGVPIDGWGVTEQWLTKYPKTAAAFHRALAKAQEVAGADRRAIDEVVPTYTQIPADTAAAMTLGTFTMEPDKASVQKLADLMHGYGYLKTKVDVGQLFASVGG